MARGSASTFVKLVIASDWSFDVQADLPSLMYGGSNVVSSTGLESDEDSNTCMYMGVVGYIYL